MSKYKSADRYQLVKMTDEDAQFIGSFIDSQSGDGRISAQELLELARPQRSPIHKYFDWDDKKAAEEWRLEQARSIMATIVVVIDDKPIRAFHSIKIEGGGRKYISLKEARKAPDIMEQIINNALSEAERWAERYQSYKSLTPIVQSIRKTKRSIANGTKKSKGKKTRRN